MHRRRRPGSGCAPRRRRATSAASTRTASTRAHRPVRRAARRDVPRPRRARRHRRCARSPDCPPEQRSASVRVDRGQPHPRHRTRPRTTCRLCSIRSASRSAATATPARSRCRRGDPTARPRSTSSRRSPATTATPSSGKTVPKSTVHGRLSVPPAAPPPAPRGAARARAHRGDAQPVPGPRHARQRPGLDGPSIRITNPLVAEESVLRTSLRPGLLQAIAFNESHRRPGVAPVRDRPRLPAGRRRAPRRVRGAVRRARRPGGARGDGGVARDRRGDGRRAHASTRPACPPGCTRPVRRRCRPARTPMGAVGEVDPDVLERVRRRRAGRGARAGPRRRARPRAEAGRRGSRPAAPVERPRPGVRARPTTFRPRSSRRRSARVPARCSSTSALFDVYRGSALPAGTRSLAYRLRLQAPDRNLTDADIADVRSAVRRRCEQARRRTAGLTNARRVRSGSRSWHRSTSSNDAGRSTFVTGEWPGLRPLAERDHRRDGRHYVRGRHRRCPPRRGCRSSPRWRGSRSRCGARSSRSA